MLHAQDIVSVIVLSLSIFGVSAAWAADPPNPTGAPAPVKDVATPETPAEVLKTQTRSNQSNDRVAAPTPTSDASAATQTAAGVVKTKTKSNQSNDRATTPAPGEETPVTDEPAEVLKTKTKSNQSND